MGVSVLGNALFEELKPDLELSQNKRTVRLYGKILNFNQPDLLHLTTKLMIQNSIVLPQNDDLWNTLRNYLRKKLIEARPQNISQEYKDIQIGFDVLSGQKYVIKGGGIMPLDYNLWRERVPDEQYDILYSMGIEMTAAFNPHKPLCWEESIRTTTGEITIPHYNTYVPAPWRLSPLPENFDIVEKYIPDFFNHFFPIEEERAYAKWWLYKLSYSRCQDILVLVGTQGNGKNTFMNLAGIIAGQHNTITASKTFGKEKFNSEVYRRKLVNLDEYHLTEAHKEGIKIWCNDLISVEKKQADPQPMENHCSFILANNYIKNINLEYKDRRFTVPELATTDMLNVWDADTVKNLQYTISHDENFRIAFPHWLIQNVKEEGIDFSHLNCLKTSKFYYICEKSKKKWFQTFKRLLTAQDSVNTADIYKKTKTKVSEDVVLELLQAEHEERKELKKEPIELANFVNDPDGAFFESLIYDANHTSSVEEEII